MTAYERRNYNTDRYGQPGLDHRMYESGEERNDSTSESHLPYLNINNLKTRHFDGEPDRRAHRYDDRSKRENRRGYVYDSDHDRGYDDKYDSDYNRRGNSEYRNHNNHRVNRDQGRDYTRDRNNRYSNHDYENRRRETSDSEVDYSIHRPGIKPERIGHYHSNSAYLLSNRSNNNNQHHRNTRPRRLAEIDHQPPRPHHKKKSSYVAELLADHILDEVISHIAISTATKFLYDKRLAETRTEFLCTELLNRTIAREGPTLVKECIEEIIMEECADKIAAEVIQEMAPVVALEFLNTEKIDDRKRDVKMLERIEGERLLEALCVEHFLSLVSQQTQTFTADYNADIILNGIMAEILLEQILSVKEAKTSTVENQLLAEHHKTLTEDIAVDTLVDELRDYCEEDLNDLDRIETGTKETDIDLPESDPEEMEAEEVFSGNRERKFNV